jgi:hypothetical protein
MGYTVKNTIFWYVMQFGCCKNRRFGGTDFLNHEGNKNWRVGTFLRSVLPWLDTANAVPSSPILVTLMMKATRFSNHLLLQEPHSETSQ